MQDILFYFDFTSPYSYLAFSQLVKTNKGLKGFSLQPVMVGKIISSVGSVGPAQIKPKREYLFKDCLRKANRLDIRLQSPGSMPFNPLPLLRLALACEKELQVQMVETIFNYGWHDGNDYEDFDKLKEYITKSLAITPKQYEELDSSKDARRGLKLNIKQALENDCFGVPYFYDQENKEGFWGLDSLEFLEQQRAKNIVNIDDEFNRFVNILEGVGND